LNAQQGSFLWDLGGVLNSQIIKNHIGIRLSFHHTNGERTLFKEYEKILFPFPNQLEVEIMRILKEKSRSNGLPQYYGLINIASLEKKGILSNGVPKEFVNKSTQKIQIENPNYFVPSFGGYEWEKYLIKNEKYNPVTIDLSKCTECIMQLIFDNVLELVDHIITAIETGEVYDYLVMIIHDEQLYEFYDQKFLIDIINTLNHYEYSKNEIANVLLECLKIGIFKQSNNYEYRSKMLKDYYQCTVTKLETVSDMILIHFYLPSNYEFLDELCKNEFNYFDKSSVHLSEFEKVYLDSVAENTKILMYQNCPSKIISYQAMRDMFVKFILPQQFLFSNPEERIYLPDYLQNFGFSVSGRTHYVVSNSSKDLPLGSITTFELPFSES
ncbi:MAG: hypothetical protein LBM93_02625, partial [Oscillospiraceae bacterium]|nr:hypothetical protein [Oscillospiraceae bacterium]